MRSEEMTQWNHPELVKLVENFEEFNTVKYAAYRMALKLRHTQKTLKFNLIQLSLATSILEDHGYDKETNHITITYDQQKHLYLDLYTKAHRQLQLMVEPAAAAELLLNLLYSIFDMSKDKELHIFQIKVALAVFSAGRLHEKFKYIAQQFVKNDVITKRWLHILLECLAKIPESFGESLSFGLQWVLGAVHSCLTWCGDTVTEILFLNWVLQEPQTLVWLSTHYRMSAAENVQHAVRCSVCKICPLVGLRYCCLHCFGYNLCQRCFLYGFVNKRHKVNHPLHEYCQITSPWEETKLGLQALLSKLHLPHRPKKSYMSVTYLPLSKECEASEGNNSLEVEKSPDFPLKPAGADCLESVTNDEKVAQIGIDAKYPTELQNIIIRLEDENRQLYQEIERLHALSEEDKSPSGSSPIEADCHHKNVLFSRQEVLEDHTYQLELLVHRLKHLLRSFQNTGCQNVAETVGFTPHRQIKYSHYESTPAARGGQALHLQSLSRFIKLHEGLEILENISKDVDEQKPISIKENFGTSPMRRSFEQKRRKTRTLSYDSNFASPDVCPGTKLSVLKEVQNTPSVCFNKGCNVPAESQYSFKDLSSCFEAMSSGKTSHPTLPKLSPGHRSGLSEIESELEVILKHLEKLFPSIQKVDVTQGRNTMDVAGSMKFNTKENKIAESIRL